jgi:hypothetical protein
MDKEVAPSYSRLYHPHPYKSRYCKGQILSCISLTNNVVCFFALLRSLYPAQLQILSVTTFHDMNKFRISISCSFLHSANIPLGNLFSNPQRPRIFLPAPPPPPPHPTTKRFSSQNNYAGFQQHPPFVKDDRSSTKSSNKHSILTS